MSSRRLLTLGVVITLGLIACSSTPHHDTKLSECTEGQSCTLRGTLQLIPGQPVWASLLVSGNTCAKLALADDFYGEANRWDRADVVVTGRAFKQPTFDESSGQVTLWYTEKERKLAMGMCDGGIGIYVDTMRSRSGRTWPPPSK